MPEPSESKTRKTSDREQAGSPQPVERTPERRVDEDPDDPAICRGID